MDNVLKRLIFVQDQGYNIVISSQPASQNPGQSSITYFQNRISRLSFFKLEILNYTFDFYAVHVQLYSIRNIETIRRFIS